MLMRLIQDVNSRSDVEERGIKTKDTKSMRQEHTIMRRDGITPDRKHAAAVLPSWVGWGGGARRQRVDTAGGPVRTQATGTRATVRDIRLFHSQPVTLLPMDAISLTLTCLHMVEFLFTAAPGLLPWYTVTSQPSTPTRLSSCTERAVDGRARQRTHRPHHLLVSSAV